MNISILISVILIVGFVAASPATEGRNAVYTEDRDHTGYAGGFAAATAEHAGREAASAEDRAHGDSDGRLAEELSAHEERGASYAEDTAAVDGESDGGFPVALPARKRTRITETMNLKGPKEGECQVGFARKIRCCRSKELDDLYEKQYKQGIPFPYTEEKNICKEISDPGKRYTREEEFTGMLTRDENYAYPRYRQMDLYYCECVLTGGMIAVIVFTVLLLIAIITGCSVLVYYLIKISNKLRTQSAKKDGIAAHKP